MEPVQYLRAIRRRWAVVVATFLVAVVAAWLALPRPSALARTTQPTSYSATAVLINTNPGNGSTATISNPSTVAALATIGQVPRMVAAAIHYRGNPADLASEVTSTASPQTGLVSIQATDPSPRRAALLANSFARELITYLDGVAAQIAKQQAASLKPQLDHLRQQIAAAGGFQSAGSALVNEYDQLNAQYQQLTGSPASSGVVMIQPAVSIPSTNGAAPAVGTGLRHSRKFQLALAGLLGLLIGVGIALALERFDTRLRTRQAAERSFGYPVLTEIPFVSRLRRRGDPPLVTLDRDSPLADAYRLLRAEIVPQGDLAPAGSGDGNGSGGNGQPRRSVTVLVTSSQPGEGKSTVAANLAATFAEAGHRALILSCDFRRPSIHRLLGVAQQPGLSDAVVSANGQRPVLDHHVRATHVQNVSVVPSGSPPPRPAEVFGSRAMRRALAEARERADVVILDTAPLLAGSEAAPILAEVDHVLVVARSGRTTPDAAHWSSELLKRLGAPVVGVALNAVKEGVARASGYGYRPVRRGLLRRGRGKSPLPRPSEQA